MRAQLFVLGCFLLILPMGLSQTFGSIGGEVRDTSGAVIAGAAVTAINAGTNASRTVTTNEAGAYSFPSLPPGIYTVKVEKAGFKTVVRNQIELQVQLAARVDFELQVGQVSESIEVSADAALLVTENATVGTVIENKRIVELPLNGRNYLQLVSLAPNVSTGFSGQGQAGARQGGIRAAQTISVGRPAHQFQSLHAGWRREHGPEFQYVRGDAVDRCAAGVQGADRRLSGGVRPADHADQRAHQVGHEPVSRHAVRVSAQRQDWTRIRYAFTSIRTAKDPFKWNQYGFTLGGPVRMPKIFNGKDKLFFMGNYEVLPQARQHHRLCSPWRPRPSRAETSPASPTGSTIPLATLRRPDGKTITGDAVPGQHHSAEPDQPDFEKAARVLPHARLCPASLNNYVRRWPRPQNRDQFILRMDYVESSKSIVGRPV